MKQRKSVKFIVAATMILLCSACMKLPENRPTQREQACADLKQKITSRETNLAFPMDRANISQEYHYSKTYTKDRCMNFEKK